MTSNHRLTIREVACRTILNKSSLGGYSLNCYTGCSHACAYCYARSFEHYHPHEEEWGTFLDVKINAVEALKRQLRRAPPGSVFLSSACDGWQPAERDYRLTRRCCELLLERGFSLHLLTKSDLVLRDFDIFAGRPVTVGISATTTDESLSRLWEPGCTPVTARWNILAEARRLGLSTTVMFSPLLPFLSDSPVAIRAMLAQAARYEVATIYIDSLNPRRRVWPAVAQLLRQHFPELRPRYQKILFDVAARAEYLAELRDRVEQIAHEERLGDRVRVCFGDE